MQQTEIERPSIVSDDHLVYLDALRESGVTNMFGAGPHLIEEFERHARRVARHLGLLDEDVRAASRSVVSVHELERSTPTRARVRQQLRRTLREIQTERCSHVTAEATGTTEARQLREGWLYSTPYRCPACGARFVEEHAQTTARSSGGAVV